MQVQAVDLGASVSMLNSANRLFCCLDGLSPADREQQRVDTVKQLGLLDAETVPVFDEATQTAARFLESPLCILGIMVEATFGLNRRLGYHDWA